MGAEALLDWPFTRWREQGEACGRESGVRRLPCKLCGGNAVTLYHLAIECRHREMVSARAAMWEGVQHLTTSTWEDGVAIIEGRAKPTFRTLDTRGWHPPPGAMERIASTLSRRHFRESDGGKFLAYWTLMAVPWGRFACAAASRRCASFAGPPTLMGELFDALTVRQGVLRELAVRWLKWSDSHIHRLARAWRQAHTMRLRTPQTVPTTTADQRGDSVRIPKRPEAGRAALMSNDSGGGTTSRRPSETYRQAVSTRYARDAHTPHTR